MNVSELLATLNNILRTFFKGFLKIVWNYMQKKPLRNTNLENFLNENVSV